MCFKKSFLFTSALILAGFSAAGYGQSFSTSVLQPTPISSDGVIQGGYPGGAGDTSYYFSTDLQKGDLITQISFKGPKDSGGTKLEFQILNSSMGVNASYYVQSGYETKQEATKSFPIDSAGHYNMRVIVKGPETTSFKIELGGTAFAPPHMQQQ